MRKATKTKGHLPSEDAAGKLIYLALVNAVSTVEPLPTLGRALLEFKIHFGERPPDIAS